VEELLDWPWLRMERFYAEFVLRTTVERLERQQDLIVASLHANGVYDEHREADRDQAIRAVEDAFRQATERLRAAANGEDEDDDDYDESNPFWAAAERGVQRMGAPRADEGDEGTARELVEGEASAEDVAAMIRNLDQT
jgi:hypothetical protein